MSWVMVPLFLAGLTHALDWYGEGLDFADALHLASCRGSARRFATFDRPLAEMASGLLEGQGLDVELLR